MLNKTLLKETINKTAGGRFKYTPNGSKYNTRFNTFTINLSGPIIVYTIDGGGLRFIPLQGFKNDTFFSYLNTLISAYKLAAKPKAVRDLTALRSNLIKAGFTDTDFRGLNYVN